MQEKFCDILIANDVSKKKQDLTPIKRLQLQIKMVKQKNFKPKKFVAFCCKNCRYILKMKNSIKVRNENTIDN